MNRVSNTIRFDIVYRSCTQPLICNHWIRHHSLPQIYELWLHIEA